jgi:hypothetical protein
MEADRPALTQIRFLAPLSRLGAIHVQAAEQDTSQKTSGGDWPGREDSAGKLTTVKDRTANRAYFMSHRNVWARVRRITFHVRRGDGSAERRS